MISFIDGRFDEMDKQTLSYTRARTVAATRQYADG
jgi:hypothetical protein